tara:strand:- start:1512 stop:1793 length:282 start_codon:yes stop_codon:yes gene_type:complete
MLWKSMIDDMLAAKYTQKRIADEIGCCQAAISEMVRKPERQPRWDRGEKLRKLHSEVMALQATSIAENIANLQSQLIKIVPAVDFHDAAADAT